MSWLIKTEKALFYFLALAFFWQWRLVWPAGSVFNEWTAFFLYATDLIIVAIFILWLGRNLCKKIEISKSPLTPPKGGEGLPPFREGGGGFYLYKNIALWIFLLFCALSLFVAADKMLAGYRLVKLLEFIGLYFYVRYNFTALYSLKRFWQWFIVGAALQSVVAIAQFLTQRSLGLKFFAESPLSPNLDGVAKIVVGGAKIVRAYGLVPHPNILAAILVVAIFGLTCLFLNQEKEKKGVVVFVMVGALFSVALFFTFSRGIIIVGGFLFLIWLAYLWRQEAYRKRVVSVVFLLLTFCFLLLTFYWPYISSRYDPTSLANGQSLDLRSFYNQEALKMFWQKPWLGVGQGSFTVALRQAVSLPDWQYQPAHNIYLLIAAESGLVSFLAFLAFLILTIRSVWLRPVASEVSFTGRQPGGILLTFNFLLLTFLLIIGLFDHFLWDLQQGQLLFWLTLGLLCAPSSLLRSNCI